jgi:hypothetical protein
LAAFRKQQDDVEKKAAAVGGQDTSVVEEGGPWSISARKRKKGTEQDFIKGVKLRKTSSADKAHTAEVKNTVAAPKAEPTFDTDRQDHKSVNQTAFSAVEAATTKDPKTKVALPVVGLGLGAYSSDEDD